MSKFFRLNSRDFIKGVIIAVICTLITGFYQLVATGGIISWISLKPVIIAAIGAGLSYLTKNLLTNSKGGFMESEPETKKA